MRDEHQQQAFRDVQGARISRWIRESEAGWLFYGPRGTAFHIFASEAERFEAEATALVERTLNPGFLPLPDWGTMMAVAILAPLAAMQLLPLPYGSLGFVLPIWFAAAVPLVLVLTTANDVAYEIALRRWRRAVADHLAVVKRGGVPAAIADKHRRYNIFLFICVGGACAYLVRVGMMMAGMIEEGFHPLDMAILAVTVLASWPAQRVDATHRRRKWLD